MSSTAFGSLESRRLMSVDLVGDTLLISGTSENGTFIVTQLANGDINVIHNNVGPWDLRR